MLKPDVLDGNQPYGPWSCRARDVWDVLQAAHEGNVQGLGRLLARNKNLFRAEYWYTQPLQLAVCGGHLEAVRLLLDSGAAPAQLALGGESLHTMALDRGHEAIAKILEDAAAKTGAVRATSDHPIHLAADEKNDARARALLDADSDLAHRRDRVGGTPLHRAVAASAHGVIELLLERGADVNALHGHGAGDESGYPAVGFQPIDLALWRDPFWNLRADMETASLLLRHGARMDLVIASALGDLERVKSILLEDPGQISAKRPSGKRALSTAVEFGHETIAAFLLQKGADPNWAEGATAPRGVALYAAARAGNRSMVEALLARGADPNAYIDSSGSATYVARTSELRDLLMEHGGHLDPYDLVWLGEDEAALGRIAAEPASAYKGCGGVLAAACTLGKRDLLIRLLQAGVRTPPVLTECRSYLLERPDMLRLLLDSGMDPNLPNWLHAAPLHDLCDRDSRGRARPNRKACAETLLDAGAAISPRDEVYRSTPLAWAARNNLPDMAAFLIQRGAVVQLPDDEPWATPLAWATRKGHSELIAILRRAGARK